MTHFISFFSFVSFLMIFLIFTSQKESYSNGNKFLDGVIVLTLVTYLAANLRAGTWKKNTFYKLLAHDDSIDKSGPEKHELVKYLLFIFYLACIAKIIMFGVD